MNVIQVAAVVDGLSVLANAAAADIKGIEGTVTLRPLRALSLVANVSLNEGQLAGNAPDIGGSSGDQLPNSPRFTTSFLADYGFPWGKHRVNAGTVLRYVSPRVAGFNFQPGLPQYRLGDYVTLDFHSEINFGRWRAQLYLHNALNSRGQLTADTSFAAFNDVARVALLEPRTVGFNLGTSF